MSLGKVRLGMAASLLLILCMAGQAQTQVEEHWSGYNYPKEIPEGVKYHIVVDGDTLWDIAGQYLGDPLLWPQVYQANPYIGDPNLIYPGDPIILDVGTIVDSGSIAANTSDEGAADGEGRSGEFAELNEFSEGDGEGDETMMEEEGEQVLDRSEVTTIESDSSEFVILPAGDRADMECSTYLYAMNSPSEVLPFDTIVAGGENKYLQNYSAGEIVYLNKGFEDGVRSGEEYSIRRRLSNVYSAGNKFLGAAIDQVGRLRVLAVQSGNATAIVSDSCFEVQIGDFLVPYEQEPIPLITEIPSTDRYAEFKRDGSGHIVYSEDGIVSFWQRPSDQYRSGY